MSARASLYICVALAGFAGNAVAATADDLLRQVQQSSRTEMKIDADREQRFLRDKTEQDALLKQAEGELAAAQGKADRIKVQFDARQKEIADLKARINGRSGDLNELFTAARQSAADFRAQAGESLLSAQFPERLSFLDTVTRGDSVLGMDQLERFWFVLQQELTENGKIARFTANIVDPDGNKGQHPVVRVGPFTATSDGDFLFLPPGSTELVAITPQPAHHLRAVAGDFEDAKESGETAVVDPSRGSLLTAEAGRPSWRERVHQGSVVGYVVIALGILGAGVSVYQFLYLLGVGARVRRQLQDISQPLSDNPLGRVLASLRGEAGTHDPEVLEVKLSEAVLRETPSLERFQGLLRMIVAAGPLLGLLGTVTGMIITFQVITEVGAADPKLMAGGISQAMITTVLGIGVAIPLLFVNVLLSSRSRALIQILDEQSAGLLARELEARRK